MMPLEGGEPIRLPVESDQVPPKHIRTVYHYTSLANWRQIQKDGILKPLRPALTLGVVLNDSLRPISRENADLKRYWESMHIVGGVDSVDFEPWREAGEHDRLLDFVAEGTGQIALVSFPVSIVKGAFILDHSFDTRKVRIEAFGKDPVDNPDDISKEEQRILEVLDAQYFRSAVKGSQYDGSFKIPEIWVPHPINLSDLTVEKMGKIEDFR